MELSKNQLAIEARKRGAGCKYCAQLIKGTQRKMRRGDYLEKELVDGHIKSYMKIYGYSRAEAKDFLKGYLTDVLGDNLEKLEED